MVLSKKCPSRFCLFYTLVGDLSGGHRHEDDDDDDEDDQNEDKGGTSSSQNTMLHSLVEKNSNVRIGFSRLLTS